MGRADAAAYAIRATVLDAAASLDAAAEARYALTITPEAERTPKGEEEAVALD